MRGRDVRRYEHNWEDSKLWLIATFPSLRLNIDCYPAIEKHLLSFGKERLEQTGGTKSRKKTIHAWYELQDTCDYHEEFEHDKLAWSDISTEPTFHLLERGIYINNTAYMIVGSNNLKYLLGVLNSSVIAFYLPIIATGLGRKGVRYFKQFVERLPIPKTNEKTDIIVQLVDKIILQQKDGENTSLESEIDRLVYQLYGLIEAEIDLLENRK